MSIFDPNISTTASSKNFSPLSEKWAFRLMSPSQRYFSPRCYGLENISVQRPALFVGNHTLYGVLDPMLLVAEVYKQKGITIRSLGDHLHFKIPIWRDFLHKLGVVEGTRENCRQLMQSGQSVLVFPGGAREVFKRKGEAYKLVWKQRTGFVRMAIENGYDIIPFASVGPDDTYSILFDANDISKWMGGALRRTGFYKEMLRGGEIIPPISRGLGLTGLPRPERFYFSFGKPISTKALAGMADDSTLLSLREKVADSIYDQIEDMKKVREQDSDNPLWRRVLTRL